MNILLKIIRKFNMLLYKKNHIISIISARINGNINLSKGCFNQKVRFWNKGYIEIQENFSIGYLYGGGFEGRISEVQVREKDASIKIGKNLACNNGLFLCARKEIEIGEDCLIGVNVTILDHNAHGTKSSERRTSHGTANSIKIGNNVWIGNNVTILGGTQIGDNSIVSTGTVVKGSFPSNVIIQGNPAIIVKEIG